MRKSGTKNWSSKQPTTVWNLWICESWYSISRRICTRMKLPQRILLSRTRQNEELSYSVDMIPGQERSNPSYPVCVLSTGRCFQTQILSAGQMWCGFSPMHSPTHSSTESLTRCESTTSHFATSPMPVQPSVPSKSSVKI